MPIRLRFSLDCSSNHSRPLFLVLALSLRPQIPAHLDPLKNRLAILVELELGDHDVAGVDADRDALAVGLVAGDTLDVDDILEAIDRGDLALAALEGAADDLDFVVLPDRDTSNLFSQHKSVTGSQSRF